MQLHSSAAFKAVAFSVALGLASLTGGAQALSEPLQSITKATSTFLKVNGSQIQDGQGKTVLLRGVNIHTDFDQYPAKPDAPLKHATEADIQYLKSIGVTSIRLSLSWRYFQNTALGFQLIDQYVQWCEKAGIYIVLDMHLVPSDTTVGQGKIWNNAAAQQKFIKLWQMLATRYADTKIIAGYDLFNAPAPADPQKWWDLARTTINAIRPIDKNHILFIEPALTGDQSFRLLNDKNVVYSFHDYKPFIITHAGTQETSDSAIPSTYSYPGLVLSNTYLAGVSKGVNFIGKLDHWEQLESHDITVPANVQFATISFLALGRVGNVWLDDVTIQQNGAAFNLFNGSMEQASKLNSTQAANWYFAGSGDFSGTWDRTVNRPGAPATDHGSLRISGSSGGGAWNQQNSYYTEPLVKVKAGDTLRLKFWVYAPEYYRGEYGVNVSYYNGNYDLYTKDHLVNDIQPYVTWAKNNNVPLYVDEFGAISSARGLSRYNLIRDKMAVMNEAGLNWSLWAYRDSNKPYYGLYLNNKLDKRLAAELKAGLQ
jgi:endoglucanase